MMVRTHLFCDYRIHHAVFNFTEVTVMFTELSYSVVEGKNYTVTVQLSKPVKTEISLLINTVSIAAEGMYLLSMDNNNFSECVVVTNVYVRVVIRNIITVEPLLKDTLNKEHLSIKDTLCGPYSTMAI